MKLPLKFTMLVYFPRRWYAPALWADNQGLRGRWFKVPLLGGWLLLA